MERAHLFGRHDRLVIDGQSYRVVRKERDTHFLQLANDGLLEDHFVPKTDKQINDLWLKGRLRHDEGYFSKVLSLLRVRHDNSDLIDLSESELRTVAWKREWCVRFLRAAGNPESSWRPKWTLPDMRKFVESEKDRMDRWYLDQFGERRPPGRKRHGEPRKAFDYPGSSTLRDWLFLYRDAGYRMEAFRTGYRRCGNRNQIDPRAVPVVAASVQKYCSVLRPLKRDIYEDVESELLKLNQKLPAGSEIKVSDKAVRRRINVIDPFIRDFSRHGPDWALRKYTPVGKGLTITRPFQRVEMDDWEVDLHSLIAKSSFWKSLSAKEKAQVPRVRCTLTAAIDCATRTIVGLNVTTYSPSAATAKSALRNIMVDKTPLARWVGTKSDWPMFGRVEFVATDGGPVFRGEFEEAVRQCRTSRSVPDQDPRMRGTIEAFFRTFKRLCRYFAGRSFANVVEKGDYPAEKMASLTFEGFLRAAVVFIVDSYHHRPHRGLEGRTPYGVWTEMSRAGLAPPLSDQQLMVAFGFKNKGVVNKHGISFVGLSYHSDELATLHRLVGNEKLQFIVDPDDLGAILVRIPDKHRGRVISEDQQFLSVGCVNDIGAGVTLVQLLEEKAAVKAFVREQQEAGKPFRLSAHANLLEGGEGARREANLPSHEMTQRDYDLATSVLYQKSRAALGPSPYPDLPTSVGGEGPGEIVAQSQRRKANQAKPSFSPETGSLKKPAPASSSKASKPPSQHPFGGGMNLYGEEE